MHKYCLKAHTRQSFLQVNDCNVITLSLELAALCQGTAVVYVNSEQVGREVQPHVVKFAQKV